TMLKLTSDTLITAFVPVPDSAIIFVGVAGSLLAMFIVALRAPAALGSNTTVTCAVPVVMLIGNVGVVSSVKSPAFVPENEMSVIDSVPVPVFENVNTWLIVVVAAFATRTDPKLTGPAGLTEI